MTAKALSSVSRDPEMKMYQDALHQRLLRLYRK
jgi:hypothetical protein